MFGCWTNLNTGMFFCGVFLVAELSPLLFLSEPLSIPDAFNSSIESCKNRGRLRDLTPSKSHPHPKTEQSPNHPVILEGGPLGVPNWSRKNFRHRLETTTLGISKYHGKFQRNMGPWKVLLCINKDRFYCWLFWGINSWSFRINYVILRILLLCNLFEFHCNQNADRKHPKGVM